MIISQSPIPRTDIIEERNAEKNPTPLARLLGLVRACSSPITFLPLITPHRKNTPPQALQKKEVRFMPLKALGFFLLLNLTPSFIGGNLAMAIEEPSYTVIEADHDFEVRSYESSVVARVKTTGDFHSAGNSGFRVLADYIFGNNNQKVKIAMTAPVKMSPASHTDEYEVEFVMPQKMTKETLPLPESSQIEIKEIPKKLMAVLKYSGTWSETRFMEHKATLMTQIQSHGYQAISHEAIFARYNPPFIPWFLRRNEVWIEVEPKKTPTTGENQHEDSKKAK